MRPDGAQSRCGTSRPSVRADLSPRTGQHIAASTSCGTSSKRPLVDGFLTGTGVADGVVEPSGREALRGHRVELGQPPMVDGARGFDAAPRPTRWARTVRPRNRGTPRRWRWSRRCRDRRGRRPTGTRRAGWPARRVNHVVGLALSWTVPQREDIGFALREVAGVRGAGVVGVTDCARVVLRRTGGSSPASRIVSGLMTDRRPEATCAPARRVDPGWRTRRRSPSPLTRLRGRIRLRTPSTLPAAPFRRRRAGRRTTAPRGAVFGGVPARAATRPAAGTGRRDDRVPR